MKKNTFKYIINRGYLIHLEDLRSFQTNWEIETTEFDKSIREFIAEDAANDHFYYHDRWEDDWPLVIEIYDVEDNFLFSAKVEASESVSFETIKLLEN